MGSKRYKMGGSYDHWVKELRRIHGTRLSLKDQYVWSTQKWTNNMYRSLDTLLAAMLMEGFRRGFF